jgi:yecA family protein
LHTPEFESEAKARTILGAIMGRYDEIAACFHFNLDEFNPIFWEGPDGDMIVSDWAAGFLDAVALRRAVWEPLFNHRRAKVLLEPLLTLGDDGERDGKRAPDDRWKEFYASKPNIISIYVLAIRDFWKDYRDRKNPQPRRGRRPRQ